jgi:hypothetical protein
MPIQSRADDSRQPPTLKDALDLYNRGFSIFPLNPYRPNDTEQLAKKPAVLQWKQYQDERASLEQVKEWWKPGNRYNIALVTGKISNLVVLDVDMKDGVNGEESLRRLEAANGPLPKTVQVLTGGGGRHIFFQHPGPDLYVKGKANAFSDEFPGLDVKADRGYVAAVPNIHPSGKFYRWVNFQSPDDVPIAPLPEWLLKLLTQDCVKSKPNLGGLQSEIFIPKGERDDRLFRMGCSMRSKGFTQEAIEAALLEHNRTNCQPPLPDNQVREKAASAARYSPGVDDDEDLDASLLAVADDDVSEFPKRAWRGPFEEYRVMMDGRSGGTGHRALLRVVGSGSRSSAATREGGLRRLALSKRLLSELRADGQL